jgi:hypothetical protein
MAYVLVPLFVALLLFAEFKQECRFIRIARDENVPYRDLLTEMAADKPTVVGTVSLVGCFVVLMVVLASGYRWPDDPAPFAGVGMLLLAAAILKAIGFRRLARQNRD